MVNYLKTAHENVIDPQSEWNDCKRGYFFCMHLNGTIVNHGPTHSTEAESTCQEMGY